MNELLLKYTLCIHKCFYLFFPQNQLMHEITKRCKKFLPVSLICSASTVISSIVPFDSHGSRHSGYNSGYNSGSKTCESYNFPDASRKNDVTQSFYMFRPSEANICKSSETLHQCVYVYIYSFKKMAHAAYYADTGFQLLKKQATRAHTQYLV